MARYKLLAGQHIQADKSKPVLGPDGEPTGRYAARTFKAGDVVDADADLVGLLGNQKFELVGGDVAAAQARIADLERQLAEARAKQPGAGRLPGEPAPSAQGYAFPGGQVAEGFERATGGRPPSGLMPAGEAAEFGATGVPEDESGGDEAAPEAAPKRAAGGSYSAEQLRGMTKDDLVEIADQKGVDVPARATKDELVKAILQAQ